MATIREWVEQTFEIVPDAYIGWRSEDGAGFAFLVNGYRTLLPVAAFAEYAASVPVPPTLTALKAIDPEDQRGWHSYFEAWKEQGIISE